MVLCGGVMVACYKIRRITADLDSMSDYRLLWCLMVFRFFGYQYEVTIRTSSGGNGRHVICWCHHKGLSKGSMFVVRGIAGDDRYRIRKDKEERMGQILFNKKDYF